MITEMRTVSSIFFSPLLGIPRELLHAPEVGFVNAYLHDSGRELDYPDMVLHLLFHPSDSVFFTEFLAEERLRGAALVDEYDYEGDYVVLVYEFPGTLSKQDYHLIMKGRYSEVSEELKQRYPKVVKIVDPVSGRRRDEMALQWRIFNKDANLKTYWEELLGTSFDADMEVWSALDLERETLHPQQLLHKQKI
jgi:hypothetical protein